MAATSVSVPSVGSGCVAIRRASHPRAGVSCGPSRGRHPNNPRGRKGPAPLSAAVSPFAEDAASTGDSPEPDSPELTRAKRALRWRASCVVANKDNELCPNLDVYTEALLATLVEHFKSVDDLEAAYVMEWYNSGETLPHMLIALDAPLLRDIQEAMPDVDKYTKEMVVDLTRASPLRKKDFDLGAPFYKKA